MELGEDNQAAGLAADEIWKRLGPVSDITPVNIDIMEEEASKIFAGNQDRTKLAWAALREKTWAHDKGVSERRVSNLGAIWEARARGSSINEILSMPEYHRLSGTDQYDVRNKIIDRSRRLTQEEKAIRQETWDARYYDLSSDPDAIAALSNDQFKALYPEIGPTNWRRLDQEKRKLTSPEALSEAKIDADLFKALAAKAGYNLSPRTERGKQKLANLKISLLDSLVAIQKDAGRKLRPDEKEKILKTLATKVTVREKYSLFGIPTTTVKPVVSVGYKGNIVVPSASRQRILSDFKTRYGRLPSENQVIDAWIAMSQEE